MDWAYMLLEWLVVNALWPTRGRCSPRPTPPESLFPEHERLEILRAALESVSDVRLIYFAASSGDETERVVSPQSLWQAQAGQWLLTAQDHVRGEKRTFRVGRMKEVAMARDRPAKVTGGVVAI